jgi:D-glycero-D-manno-heptose 1,7-bisphosphate phosphatase
MKLIILDRDGVINHDSADYIKSAAEWLPLPGSLEAIARLNQRGYRVVVATNQSGVGRGLFTMQALNAMHDKMHALLSPLGGRIDAVFLCPHAPEDHCQCRKPLPGMMHDIGRRFNVRLEDTLCVGDSLRDLQAIAAVGGKPLLVRTGKGEATLAKGGLPAGTQVFADLAAVADHLLEHGA